MKFVLVLENDTKIKNQVETAIKSIDENLQIVSFDTLEKFANWIKELMVNGKVILSNEKENHVPLIISNENILGYKHVHLIKKTRELFLNKQLSIAENPTSFVITTFNDKLFDFFILEEGVVTNYIVKPFDNLILQQHLIHAIEGRVQPSFNFIQTRAIASEVEMLTRINLEAISDVGFQTLSVRQIKEGTFARYYGDVFKHDSLRYVHAVCMKCEPHPEKKDHFKVWFSYFGPETQQLIQIRKSIKLEKSKTEDVLWEYGDPKKRDDIHTVLIDAEESATGGLQTFLEKSIRRVKVHSYSNLESFLLELSPEDAIKSNPPLEPFKTADTIEFKFDPVGQIFFGMVGEKAPKEFCGLNEEALKKKNNWFFSSLPQVQQEAIKALIREGKANSLLDPLIKFDWDGRKYYAKLVTALKKDEFIHITLSKINNKDLVKELARISNLPKQIDVMLINSQYISTGSDMINIMKEKILNITKQKPKVFLLSKRKFQETNHEEAVKSVDDIFFKPIDRLYFKQKFRSYFSQFQSTETPIAATTAVKAVTIKVSRKVKIKEVSEASIKFELDKKMPLGSMREFLFQHPNIAKTMEIVGIANHSTDPGPDGMVSNQFVFFGVTDELLKFIRVWLMENYVQAKKKELA